ncbi:MAG: hypothetical protein VYA55_22635 [Pseudomonadota bacterium]|nr:hypothetical protein [Pseudomonadota bacterium]
MSERTKYLLSLAKKHPNRVKFVDKYGAAQVNSNELAKSDDFKRQVRAASDYLSNNKGMFLKSGAVVEEG